MKTTYFSETSKALLIIFIPLLIVGMFKLFGPFIVDPEMFFGGVGVDLKGQLIRGWPTIEPNVAQTTLANGSRAVFELFSGKLPLWNHYTGLGQPLLGEMQSAALFPFTWLLALPKGQILMQLCLQFLGGVGSFFFLRKFGLGLTASVLGGILYEFNGVYSWLQNSCFNPIAFFPWILFFVEALFVLALSFNDKRKINFSVFNKYVIWGSILASLAVYSGFPEIVFLYSFFTLFWILLRLRRLDFPQALFFIKCLLILAILSFCLSAPVLSAFFDFLNYANVTVHSGDGFKGSFLNPLALIQYIFPYGFGPIFGIPHPTLYGMWGGVGGYIGFMPVFFGILALLNKKNFEIKLFLLCWLFFSLLATHGLNYANIILYKIPAMKMVSVYRYIAITWIYSFILLVCFFIDEIQNKKNAPNLVKYSLILLFTLLVIVSFFILMNDQLFNVKNFILVFKSFKSILVWPLLSLTFVIVLILLSIYFLNKKTKNIRIYLALLCIFESFSLFIFPNAAYPQQGSKDYRLVDFFKKNIGFQRFVNIPGEPDVISVNLGSLYGIPQLNSNDVPQPANVVNYINKTIDPFSSFIFLPDFPVGVDIEKRKNFFFNNLDRYAEIGVRYYVGRKENLNSYVPFQYDLSQPFVPFNVNINEEIIFSFTLSNSKVNKKIQSISLMQGNYGNTATGILYAKLCTVDECVESSFDIKKTIDNTYTNAVFNKPLKIKSPKHNKLTLTFKRLKGDGQFALWMASKYSRDDSNVSVLSASTSYPKNYLPKIRFNIEDKLAPVYENEKISVFEIKNFAKYFTAKNCIIAPIDRNRAIINCESPAKLIRLETYMPGWTAIVNGKIAQVRQYQEVFQMIDLPKGYSEVTFDYKPMFFRESIFLFFCVIIFFVLKFFINFSRKKK